MFPYNFRVCCNIEILIFFLLTISKIEIIEISIEKLLKQKKNLIFPKLEKKTNYREPLGDALRVR